MESSAFEVEAALVGSLYHYPKGLAGVRSIVKPDYFRQPDYARAFEIMLRLDDEGKEINLVSLMSCGISSGLLEHLEKYDSPAGADLAARKVAEEYARGLLRKGLPMIQAHSESGDVGERMAELRELLSVCDNIFSNGIESDTKRNLEEYDEYLDQQSRGEQPFLLSGYDKLDHSLGGGFDPADFAVVGGGPGSGKTAWLLNLALNFLAREYRVGLVEAEMTPIPVLVRMNATYSGTS